MWVPSGLVVEQGMSLLEKADPNLIPTRDGSGGVKLVSLTIRFGARAGKIS
jgi:hypothetical protein